MRVNCIQDNNIVFGAKLRVLEKYFVGEELRVLTQKADKIGYENDVIELNYTDFKDSTDKIFNPGSKINTISDTLKARFLPNGEGIGTEIFSRNISGNCFREFWAKEYNLAIRYLDKLFEKYPNERVGVSIIEN